MFTHLHVHTEASSDGLAPVDQLVAYAKELGYSSLAMTDHGTLANSVSFWMACKEHGIKPILGVEAYLLYNGKRHHITFLAKNEIGFNNLAEVNSRGHINSKDYPNVTIDMFRGLSEGIIVLTGCVSSVIHEGELSDAIIYVNELVDVFGKDSVFVEVMFVADNDSWTRPIQVAKATGIRPVLTNDVHYPREDQFDAHQVMVRARKGYTYDSKRLWLKSPEQMSSVGRRFVSQKLIDVMMKTTQIIDNSVEFWDMTSPPHLPMTTGAGAFILNLVYKNFGRVCDKGLVKDKEVAVKRIISEWEVIREMGFVDYFFILYDIIQWAKSHDVKVGPGRGSAAGSYILYLLGITQIDPLKYNLSFERFLNHKRKEYPDVDVDFESVGRQKVLDYANERWEARPIATYSRYSHKSVVHDIARVLGIPRDLEIEMADREPGSTFWEEALSLHPNLDKIYNSMLGQIRHTGKHAGGVVITERNVPLERAGDQILAAWTEGANKELSAVGVVKFDLLGITALSQIKLMEELTGKKAPPEPDGDDVVFDIFRKGDVGGIFQWTGSQGIKDLTVAVSPKSFEDLIAINSLYRPGALDAGTAEKYPEYMISPRKLHPRIDKHLESTYGVICFQEQVMAVFAEITGGSLAEADMARRTIVKSKVGDSHWEADVRELHEYFFSNGTKQGFPHKLLESVWHELMTHARYSFNKAHSAAYAKIAWEMAWFKYYYPGEFYTAMMTYDPESQLFLFEAVSKGIRIAPPHINISTKSPEFRKGTIYLPISNVKFFGEKGVEFLLQEREKNGPFETFEDFDKRLPKKLVNARVRRGLLQIRALDGLDGDPTSAVKDFTELPIVSDFAAQQEYLGYVIPTDEIMSKINKLSKHPDVVCGIVESKKEKKNKWGPYATYRVSPSGMFWIRGDEFKVNIGDFVAVKITKFGKAKSLKVIEL